VLSFWSFCLVNKNQGELVYDRAVFNCQKEMSVEPKQCSCSEPNGGKMSFWKRLVGVVEGPSVHRPILATPQLTFPDQDKRDDIKASAGVCSEATAIFLWKADVMPTSYGRVAQDALSSAFRIE